MKTALLTLIAIFIFGGQSFAQNNKSSSCPNVSITGPWGIEPPDVPLKFTGNVSDSPEKYNIQYKWTVSGGTIAEGQDTSAIKVLPKNSGESTTATLEIIGLPEGCANKVSETMIICILRSFVSIDDFSIVPPKIDKTRLSNFFEVLKENPSAQGYIIEAFTSKISAKTVKQKNRAIIDYLTSIGIAKDRITLLNTLSDQNQTQLFLVPAGASPPECKDCITAELN